MNKEEREILYPLIKNIRGYDENLWEEVKYETQFGPEFIDFPYYPSACNYMNISKRVVNKLDESLKKRLVELWKAKKLVIQLETDDEILNRYSLIIVDEIVRRAISAGARTDFSR